MAAGIYVTDGDNAIHVIDTATNTEITSGSIVTPSGPGFITVALDGAAYVVSSTDGTIYRIAGNTGTQSPQFSVQAGDSDETTGAITYRIVSPSDADGDSVSYTYTQPAHGTVTLANGSYVYTPDGTPVDDEFTVYANDGHGGITAKRVIVDTNVSPVLDEVQTDDDIDTSTGTVTGLVTATDGDGDDLTYSLDTQASKGTAIVHPDGTWLYTPNPLARHDAATDGADDTITTDTFSVEVEDGHGGIIHVPVAVNIDPTNQEPTFDVHAGDPDPDSGQITYTIVNPNDGDGDTITYTTSDPSSGTVELRGGQYVYTPYGSGQDDEFTIYAEDGHGGLSEQLVTVHYDVASIPDTGVSYRESREGAAVVNAAKDRAYQLSSDGNHTYLTVINTTTGEAVNDPSVIAIPGDSSIWCASDQPRRQSRLRPNI